MESPPGLPGIYPSTRGSYLEGYPVTAVVNGRYPFHQRYPPQRRTVLAQYIGHIIHSFFNAQDRHRPLLPCLPNAVAMVTAVSNTSSRLLGVSAITCGCLGSLATAAAVQAVSIWHTSHTSCVKMMSGAIDTAGPHLHNTNSCPVLWRRKIFYQSRCCTASLPAHNEPLRLLGRSARAFKSNALQLLLQTHMVYHPGSSQGEKRRLS